MKSRRRKAINPILEVWAHANFKQHRKRIDQSGNHEGSKNVFAILGASEKLPADEKGQGGNNSQFHRGYPVVETHAGQNGIAGIDRFTIEPGGEDRNSIRKG